MSNEIANGHHYKKSHVLETDLKQPIDPAWIASKYPGMSPMRFTVLKKILRCGTGGKSYEQDLQDCIGALRRELELIQMKPVSESKPVMATDVEKILVAEEQQKAGLIVETVKRMITANNELHGLVPVDKESIKT